MFLKVHVKFFYNSTKTVGNFEATIITSIGLFSDDSKVNPSLSMNRFSKYLPGEIFIICFEVEASIAS